MRDQEQPAKRGKNVCCKFGKALEIFSVRESDLRTFVRGAKNYGIVYCVLRNAKHSPDGLCDIMVKADDATKINRLVERFKLAVVDRAKIDGLAGRLPEFLTKLTAALNNPLHIRRPPRRRAEQGAV
jgi:hypothetical protein